MALTLADAAAFEDGAHVGAMAVIRLDLTTEMSIDRESASNAQGSME